MYISSNVKATKWKSSKWAAPYLSLERVYWTGIPPRDLAFKFINGESNLNYISYVKTFKLLDII